MHPLYFSINKRKYEFQYANLKTSGQDSYTHPHNTQIVIDYNKVHTLMD